jgi:hypothetical protein
VIVLLLEVVARVARIVVVRTKILAMVMGVGNVFAIVKVARAVAVAVVAAIRSSPVRVSESAIGRKAPSPCKL